jgi:hypothetical protein
MTSMTTRSTQQNRRGFVLRSPLRCAVLAAATLVALSAYTTTGHAQVYGTGSHSVNVQVAPITVLAVQGGAVAMSITDAQVTAGIDAMTVENQATRLLWGTNSSARKITAHSSLASPRFELRLAAVAPTRGTAAPEMILGPSPHDLLRDVGRSLGSCTLRYTGNALASQGPGTDIHTVTFTVTTQ